MSRQSPAGSSSRSRWSGLAEWEGPAALLLAVVVFSVIQSSTYSIIGEDGYYHIKVASFIREAGLQGPRIDFPWLRFTILNEADYTDHHLLFHILQAPFTMLEPRIAAKFSAVVFAALGAWGCYHFMARTGVRWPLAWLGLLLAISHTYVWRQSQSRPQGLAILVIVGVAWLTFERRPRWLIPLGLVSVWLFNGFLLPFVVPIGWLVARLALDRELDWRPLGCLAIGTGLGLLLHPYFPNNVVFAAWHLFPKSGLSEESGVPVGLEWYPYNRWGYFSRVGPPLGLMLSGVLPMLRVVRGPWSKVQGPKPKERRAGLEPATVTLGLVALAFLAMVTRSQRMIEYFPAFAALFAARSWSVGGLALPAGLTPVIMRWRLVLGALAVAVLGVWLAWSVVLARRDARNGGLSAQYFAYRDAALWMADNSPAGSLVFNVDWDEFPQLFYWNSHNVYVVGLDLTYLSLYDEDLYRVWRSINNGSLEQPSRAMRERFGATFAFSDPRHGRFIARAAEDPGLEEVFRSPNGIVWRVLGEGPGKAPLPLGEAGVRVARTTIVASLDGPHPNPLPKGEGIFN